MKKFAFLDVLVFGGLLIAGVSSCHKHNDDDAAAPVLTVTNPAANGIYKATQPIEIKGNVADNSLHELSIWVKQLTDGAVLFERYPVVHELSTYTIYEVFTPTAVTDTTAVFLEVKAEDHSGNIVQDTVPFRLVPQ